LPFFYEAIENEKYECFVNAKTTLPMMYIDDCLKATFQIMDAPSESIKIRTSYNLAALSFTVEELASEIKKHIPNFLITYKPDPRRQSIADTWPHSINDGEARKDWNWQHHFDLKELTNEMLKNLIPKLQKKK